MSIRRIKGIKRLFDLRKFLKSHGYICESVKRTNKLWAFESEVCEWLYVDFTGFGLRGAFCSRSEQVHPQLNYCVSLEVEEYFNKWSRCPVTLDLNTRTNEEVLYWLNYLQTPEGNERASSYGKIIDDYKAE